MDYQEIKQKIKNCRDILVGIVPSPEAQVQQITVALMYKFMDDMDKKEQEENDAPPMFFTGEFAKYSWTKLLSPQVGSQERMNLYGEAIEKMNENKGIPQLFRDIFKGAFLPYRNPETLSMFLKEINGFTYDNSENLGNAFELLLSIMGSQGDAGMFRTPRHIIDFIVDAVDPQKNEQICDPACGSAGFLISTYNHIIKANTKDKKGDLLSPEEKKKLIKNFVGYDISPDMVRLSKVNLYLHSFPSPTIFEYDTLSSEEKWDENFDVMLANPPFMSPKGGIRPHKRFSVQANRSEVLFVDYILEHLRPNGRAGIIVPEGIIFQSATAYKALRKLLMEDGLLAVVSLPAGVFNPYSGVKTSILLFDNGLAKKTKDILFLKIQNDGYDLGAQRREHDKNDLPLALEIIKKYRVALKENKKFGLNAEQAKFAHLVAKDKIAESGEYNLSGDRYKEVVNYANQKWPMVELKKITDIGAGNSAPQNKELFKNGKYPFFRTSDVGVVHISDNLMDSRDKLNEVGIKGLRLFPKNTILFPKSGASTFLNHRAMLGVDGYVSSHLATITPNENKILPKFLFNLLKNIDAKSLTNDQNYPSLKTSEIAKIKIPLPPIEVQREIVEQIEVKQNAIDAAKAVIDNLERERRYFGQSLRKLESVEWVELGQVCEELFAGGDVPKDYSKIKNKEYTVPIYSNGIGDKGLYGFAKKARVNRESVTISARGTIGYPEVRKEPFYPAIRLIVAIPKVNVIDVKFLKYILETIEIYRNGNSIPQLTIPMIRKEKIILPPLEIQKQLVAEMEEQEKIIEANKKLVGIMEQKIAEVLSEI